jgi:hypothetical protein
VLFAAAALAMAPAVARAQDASADLRGGFESGFPTSPASAPFASPEDNSPPSLAGLGAAADSKTTSGPSQDATNVDATSTTADSDDPSAPNYGKLRKKKPKLYHPNPKGSPPLSPLVPYRGAPGTQKVLNPKGAPPDAVDPSEPAPTLAVIPSPLRVKRPIAELDPYAPVGVAAGALRLLPFVETSAGYETNPNQVTTGVKPSSVLRVETGLDVKTDLPTNSVTASLRGGYSDFPSNSVANRPDISGVVDGRLDVTANDQINAEGRFTLTTQTPGSPLLAVPNSVYVTGRPTIVAEGVSLGETHTFNRLALTLRGTFDRIQYGDATQSDGSLLRYSQDNYNDYGIVARAAYELTPALIPFTEVAFDDRVRDDPIDLSGYARDSIGGSAKVGSTFEFTRLLTGTASAGYAERHYADPRLVNLKGPTVDGSLIYTATPLTTVSLTASTFLSETTLPGATGAISRSLSLEVDHVFFKNFTVSGIATYQPNTYQGVAVNEAFTQFTLKGAYAVSREVSLIGSASRQNLTSSLAGSSFTDNIFLLGVRLQR